MNTKLRKTISELCKDMGLTEKALDELAELGSQGLTDTSTDEDIKKAADSLVPYAKLMQGEITRKTSKRNQTPKPKKKDDGDEGDDDDDDKGIAAIVAKQLAPFKEQMDKLQSENDALKAEKAKGERDALIAAEAKKLGIPDYLIKRVAIADDADVAKELAAFKQDLVNNNLMPKDAASVTAGTDDQMKAAAKSWAETLPDK
jgi:hypothetical protein